MTMKKQTNCNHPGPPLIHTLMIYPLFLLFLVWDDKGPDKSNASVQHLRKRAWASHAGTFSVLVCAVRWGFSGPATG